MQPSEIISDTGTFIFLILVLMIGLGATIMLTQEGKTLSCDVLRQLSSRGLKFLLDASALSCE